MSKLEKSCILVWGLVICLFAYFVLVNINFKKEEIKEIIKEEIVEEKYVNEVIVDSIKITKKHFSEEISNAVYNASAKYNIPSYVIYAIIATESGKNNTNDINKDNFFEVNYKAKSSYNCIGLMQISPKYALAEYNKYNKTNYTENDLYNIKVNIDVGVWYYKQFISITTNPVELYVIYNVGFSEYNRNNPYWCYNENGKWFNNVKNNYYYMNDLFPPRESWKKGLYGKNKLPDYNAKKRFEKCLTICKEQINY